MEFFLTRKIQNSKHDKDGKRRNYVLYFLNDKLLLKQKYPYDPKKEKGYDGKTWIRNEFLLKGKLYQTRLHVDTRKERIVSFPISKNRLAPHNIPPNRYIFIRDKECWFPSNENTNPNI